MAILCMSCEKDAFPGVSAVAASMGEQNKYVLSVTLTCIGGEYRHFAKGWGQRP